MPIVSRRNEEVPWHETPDTIQKEANIDKIELSITVNFMRQMKNQKLSLPVTYPVLYHRPHALPKPFYFSL